MNYEDILKLKKGFDEAETEEPFLYADRNNLKVVGDANETQLKTNDYEITFETESGERVVKKYEGIHVTPRKRLGVARLLVKMLPYFRKQEEDGSVSTYEDTEAAELFLGMDDEIYDMMYDLAVTVLDIPSELKDYMQPVSVLLFTVKLINDNPAIAKEADMSFG